MAHCSIVGSNNKQADSREVTYYHLPKDPQRWKSWLTAIHSDKGNLPSNVFVCSKHFEDKYSDKSWDLQNRLFYVKRPIKRKLISTAIPTLLNKQISTPKKTSKIRAKQKEKKKEAKLWNRVWISQI